MKSPPLHLTLLLSAALLAARPAAAARPDPLKAPPVLKSMLLRETPVEYAMWILGEAWDRHIVVNETAKKALVRLFLKDIDCMSALKAICHSNGLWFKEDPSSGIIYVETMEEYIKGSRLGDKKFIEVVTVVYPRAEDLGASLQEVFRDMVVYVQPDYENGDESDDIDRALERLGQLASLSTIVEGSGSGSSTSSSGLNRLTSGSSRGSSGRSRGRSGRNRAAQNLPGLENVTDYYDDIDRLNKRTDLVAPDAEGAPRTLNPDVVFVAAVRRPNALLLRSSDPESIKQVREVIAELDRPKPQVLLEVKVLALDVTDEKERMLDLVIGNFNDKVSSGFAEGLGDVPWINSDGTVVPKIGRLGILGGAAVDARSFVFQAMDNHLQSRLKILDNKGRIERLATPSLMIADLEASRIFVGDETTILTGVETTVNVTGGDNPVITTETSAETERRDIGTTLVITPKIHADQTVTIRIMQENARIGKMTTIKYGNAGNQFESADINKQTVSSTVVAKSGELIALGGLMTKTKNDTLLRIPFLADLPLIGKAFEKKYVNDVESELIVLIRPYVMLTPDMAERLSQRFVMRTVKEPALLKEALDGDGEARADENVMNTLNDGMAPMATPLE
jgi:general secretion pathway protein D